MKPEALTLPLETSPHYQKNTSFLHRICFLSDYHQWPTSSRTHLSLVISFGIILCRLGMLCQTFLKNQDAIICKCVCRQRFYKVLYSWYIHLLPINLFACVMWCYFWAIHNIPSLLLPPSYGTGNGMWTPIPILNEARANWKGTCPAIACANNLFHFCSATYDKAPFCSVCSRHYTSVWGAVWKKARACMSIWVCLVTCEHNNMRPRHWAGTWMHSKWERKRSMYVYVQVRCTPVYFEAHYTSRVGRRWGFSLCGFCLPWDPPFCPWHAWHGAFLSEWWPHMMDSILHAYNQPMRAAAAPRDWKAEFEIRNVKRKEKKNKMAGIKWKKDYNHQNVYSELWQEQNGNARDLIKSWRVKKETHNWCHDHASSGHFSFNLTPPFPW